MSADPIPSRLAPLLIAHLCLADPENPFSEEELEVLARLYLRSGTTTGSCAGLAGSLSILLQAPTRVHPFHSFSDPSQPHDAIGRVGRNAGSVLAVDMVIGGRLEFAHRSVLIEVGPSSPSELDRLARAGWIVRAPRRPAAPAAKLLEAMRVLAPVALQFDWRFALELTVPLRRGLRVGSARVGSTVVGEHRATEPRDPTFVVPEHGKEPLQHVESGCPSG